MPDQVLPNPDVTANPSAAVQTGAVRARATDREPDGHGRLRSGDGSAVLAGDDRGGVLFVIVTAIQTSRTWQGQGGGSGASRRGDGLRLLAQAPRVIMIGWFAWREMGLGDY